MIALDELLGRVHGLDRQELAVWVENRWVVPEQRGGAWLFHEVDVARVELIREIRHEFAIDDEAVPVVARPARSGLRAAASAAPAVRCARLPAARCAGSDKARAPPTR